MTALGNRVDSRDRYLQDELEQVLTHAERELLAQNKRLLQENGDLMTKLENLLSNYEA